MGEVCGTTSEQLLEGVGGVAFGLLDGVYVAVGGLELGVTKAGGDILDVGAVTKRQRLSCE